MILFVNHRARMARRIAAFHAGDLSPSQYEAVARHLGECPYCSDELRALEETERLLRGSAPRVASLPRETSRALFERALDESGVFRRRTGVRWQLYAWATPAVLLLVGSGVALQEVRKPVIVQTERVATIPPREQPDPQVVISQPATGVRMGPPAPAEETRPAPAPKRLVHAISPRRPKRVKARPEVIQLVPSEPMEWIPEPVLAPGVEQVELIADGELAPVFTTPTPVVDVQVVKSDSEPAGTARVAAWWREPSGEWFWKQARVPKEKEQIELLLVSLSQERIWGYWKEETE